MPEKNQEVKWLKYYSYLVEKTLYRSLAGIIGIGGALFGILWTICEASGITGSWEVVIILFLIVFFCLAVLVLFARVFRWALLYIAVKEYTRKNLMLYDFGRDTVLVGGGAGGALAVGMLSKALQELGREVPSSLVIDCQYRGGEFPETGTLLKEPIALSAKECFIVHSYLGTGRSLTKIKNVLKLNKRKVFVFSFVISDALVGREEINHYLIVGTRAIIPWPRSGD